MKLQCKLTSLDRRLLAAEQGESQTRHLAAPRPFLRRRPTDLAEDRKEPPLLSHAVPQ